MPETLTLTVSEEDSGQRLDRLVAQRLTDVSRSRVQALIEAGHITLNDVPARAADKPSSGDRIAVRLPDPAPTTLQAEDIPLRVVYEDADLLVMDKPAGLVVHPAPGHPTGTLVNALLSHVPDLAGIGGEARPGIVHRLDRDTSGLMVVAKHDRAQRLLAAQLKERRMDKRYVALVDGVPQSESGTIEAPIGRDPRHPRRMAAVPGGRPSTTHFRILRRYAKHTLLECKPVTGRTHQIRVHLASIGCPVVADRVYGRSQPSVPLDRHFLHAGRLAFRLLDGTERTFEAPLPPELESALTRIA
ncbi:MAG TPA: RluA family pseudouridine synthase [Chloroflexota bacterium]|nr:RluA family pseudouridine synthase [Chloroflexota bacterium]